MPSKYSEEQKNEAIAMLHIGEHIGFVHYTTGIPERTLRSRRQKLGERHGGGVPVKIGDAVKGAGGRQLEGG